MKNWNKERMNWLNYGSMPMMQSKNLEELPKGIWVKAKELPYYPSIWETMGHWFGVHQWTYKKPFKCVMCGKNKLKGY